jgi:sporulation protein YlmC with PRC-barrel domain
MTTSSGHTSAIRVSKVIGTNVQDASGKKIGEVKDVIVDKQSNNIMFAVLSFGGLLGMGEKYHPIPWAALDYDESRNAYVVDYSKEQLQAAPVGSVEELTQNDGLNFRDRTYAYYEADRYW